MRLHVCKGTSAVPVFPEGKKTEGPGRAPPPFHHHGAVVQAIVDSESYLKVSTVGVPDITGRSFLSSWGYAVVS